MSSNRETDTIERGNGAVDPVSMKSGFAEFMIGSGAVRFGSFTLKSGRTSPYFINLGVLGDGASIARLGEFYASALVAYGLAQRTDIIFGPSYKGVPIAVSTAIALSRNHGIPMRFAFNRKEAKAHGEGGVIIGSPLKDGDRVGLLDDVMTTGKTKEETLDIIRSAAKVEVSYVLIAVDRMERGETDLQATEEFRERYGIPVHSIANIREIAGSGAARSSVTPERMEAIGEYLKAYGGKARV
jgi:orotate phosphoribosyltransferase